MKQNITILGSTGSIGTNTLDVLSKHLDRFQVFALTAAKQVDVILAQCAQFKPKFAVMAQEDAGRLLAARIKPKACPSKFDGDQKPWTGYLPMKKFMP